MSSSCFPSVFSRLEPDGGGPGARCCTVVKHHGLLVAPGYFSSNHLPLFLSIIHSNILSLYLPCHKALKNEIRGSDEYLIVGIDVAKERHNAFFGTAAGRTLHKGLFFDNTVEGFRKLLTMKEVLRVQYDLTKVVIGLEPTAN